MNTDHQTVGRGVDYGPWLERWIVLPSLAALYPLTHLLRSSHAEWYWYVPAFAVPLLMGFAISWRGFLDVQNGKVVENARLFGKRVVKTRILPITDFKGITFERRGSEPDEWWVGLRHKSGRKIWLRGCGAELRYAEEFAWRLSCDTGLKMEEVRRRK